MTRLEELVSVSARIAATRARSEKASLLADLLRRVEPPEIEIAVAFLSGGPRQARLGVGGASLGGAFEGTRAVTPALTLSDVDGTFERIASAAGPGSMAERTRLLAGLFGRAMPAEADFLARLIVGELRQGALEGIALEAVARR